MQTIIVKWYDRRHYYHDYYLDKEEQLTRINLAHQIL
jgi:hypothetical protein